MTARATALLPRGATCGTLAWLIAASTMLTMLAVAAAMGLAGVGRAVGQASADSAIVQIVEANPARRDADATRALRLLKRIGDVRTVNRVGRREMDRLLAPYLGEMRPNDLPVPAMITLTLKPGADRARITRALAAIPSARLDTGTQASASLAHLLSGLRVAAILGVVIAATATALVALLAARAALAAHDHTIAILHSLGATDRQLAQMMGRRTLPETIGGALIGFVPGNRRDRAALTAIGRNRHGSGRRGLARLATMADAAARAAADRHPCRLHGSPDHAGHIAGKPMMGRLIAALALLWALGFAAFATNLAGPAGDETTDAIVVLTGGPGRVQRGLAVLAAGRAKRLLISGVGQSVRKADLARIQQIPADLLDRIDLGRQAIDTRSNADETAAWLARRNYHSIRLITTDWHMRRAQFELGRTMSGIVVVPDGVPSEPSLLSLLREYDKYLLRRAGALAGR